MWGSPIFRIAVFLIAIDVLIVALYGVHLMMDGRANFLDLNMERSVGAWWGGGMYLVAGVALLIPPIFAPRRCATSPAFYAIAACGLAFLSADEIIGLHERLTDLNLRTAAGLPMFAGRHGAWIPIYAAIFVAFLLAFARPIGRTLRADPRSAAIFLMGFGLLLLGAVCVEVMGYYDLLFGEFAQIAVEESLELFGVSLMLIGAARHTLSRLTFTPRADRISSRSASPISV